MSQGVHGVIRHTAYSLGEERPYSDAGGYQESKIPRRPDMWGWGYYRQATQGAVHLAVQAARRALEQSQTQPASIDYLLICGASLAHAGLADASGLMRELGTYNAYPIFAGANGCNAMLSGLMLADALVAGRRAQSILVVASDALGAGELRFRRYAIFSDAACACLVHAHADAGMQILGSATASDTHTMHEESSFSSDLAVRTNAQLLQPAGLESRHVRKVFCNNVYLPITMLKEQEGGFSAQQIYVDNVKRIGHCFSADPLINLTDFVGTGGVAAGENFMVAADSPGLRSSLLLRAL